MKAIVRRSQRSVAAGLALAGALLSAGIYAGQTQETAGALAPGRQRVMIRSSRDDSLQPSYVIVPPKYDANGAGVPLGGAPGTSATVDSQYRERSPLTNLSRAFRVPIDIWGGRNDDDVSVTHALLAFNKLAEANNSPLISPEEIAQLARLNGRLDRPQPGDQISDPALGRTIFLRRTSGPSRVTAYDGVHMTLAAPTFEWFEKHVKP